MSRRERFASIKSVSQCRFQSEVQTKIRGDLVLRVKIEFVFGADFGFEVHVAADSMADTKLDVPKPSGFQRFLTGHVMVMVDADNCIVVHQISRADFSVLVGFVVLVCAVVGKFDSAFKPVILGQKIKSISQRNFIGENLHAEQMVQSEITEAFHDVVLKVNVVGLWLFYHSHSSLIIQHS